MPGGRVTWGVLSLVTFFAQAKKVTRSAEGRVEALYLKDNRKIKMDSGSRRTAHAGCRSEYSRSEWPEWRAADAASNDEHESKGWIPAFAGMTSHRQGEGKSRWIPAFAGMTCKNENDEVEAVAQPRASEQKQKQPSGASP